MLQDKEEELERLNTELLSEETAPEAEQEQEGLLNEEQLDAFLEDSTKIGSMEDTIVYQNFSNDYGAEEMVQDTPAEPEKKNATMQRTPIVIYF